MENSIFFNHILRALGFTVYTAGVKIRPRVGGIPGGNFTGWWVLFSISIRPRDRIVNRRKAGIVMILSPNLLANS